MSLRAKFVLYLIFIHLVFAGVTPLLLKQNRLWLVALEIFYLLSFLVGLKLIRDLFEPIRLIRTAIDFIKGREFSTRLREVGQTELDPLIQVYNRMADSLRQERIHNEEQERFLQRIIAASPSGILVLDLDGRLTLANPSAESLLRREVEVLIGRALNELGSPLADRLAGLEPPEILLVSLQGRRRVKCTALSFMDRGFARRFIILDELTEELYRSEKAAYEKLIRVMSHEVNNTAGAVSSLMSSCLTYGEQLADADRSDFSEAISVAISRTGRMNSFMQEFAEVVRLPSPHKRPCDVEKLLEEVALLLKEESDQRRIDWQWRSTTDLPPVKLDQAQMEQAFINICKNGMEAIGEEGTLEVSTGIDRGHPFVVISDSGGGIPEDVREHLFTPFFSSKENGQGIGLTMVQEILLGHGFDFSLESDEAGRTAFTIVF